MMLSDKLHTMLFANVCQYTKISTFFRSRSSLHVNYVEPWLPVHIIAIFM